MINVVVKNVIQISARCAVVNGTYRVYFNKSLRVLMKVSIFGSFLGLPVGACFLMAWACLLLAGALLPLNWLCFFSIKTGAICLNLLERESLISWNCAWLSMDSSSVRSLTIDALVLL